MPNWNDYEIPPEQEQLDQLLMKIVAYQHSLPDGRAVELEELKRKGVLALADIEFLTSHSVTYKPHLLSDHHALDMFHMPTPEGGCVFIGPGGPPLIKRRALRPVLRLVTSSVLSLLVLYLFPAAGRDPRWLISLAGVAAGAFVLLVPVMVRGDSWQKMVAGALLFVPCLGLVVAVRGVVSSL